MNKPKPKIYMERPMQCDGAIISFFKCPTKAFIINRIQWSINTHVDNPEGYFEYFFHDGFWWMKDTQESWLEHLDWISLSTLKNHLRDLKAEGWILTADYSRDRFKRATYFRVNQEKIDKEILTNKLKQANQKAYEDRMAELAKLFPGRNADSSVQSDFDCSEQVDSDSSVQSDFDCSSSVTRNLALSPTINPASENLPKIEAEIIQPEVIEVPAGCLLGRKTRQRKAAAKAEKKRPGEYHYSDHDLILAQRWRDEFLAKDHPTYIEREQPSLGLMADQFRQIRTTQKLQVNGEPLNDQGLLAIFEAFLRDDFWREKHRVPKDFLKENRSKRDGILYIEHIIAKLKKPADRKKEREDKAFDEFLLLTQTPNNPDDLPF